MLEVHQSNLSITLNRTIATVFMITLKKFCLKVLNIIIKQIQRHKLKIIIKTCPYFRFDVLSLFYGAIDTLVNHKKSDGQFIMF